MYILNKAAINFLFGFPFFVQSFTASLKFCPLSFACITNVRNSSYNLCSVKLGLVPVKVGRYCSLKVQMKVFN